jgi:hypothetical protein
MASLVYVKLHQSRVAWLVALRPPSIKNIIEFAPTSAGASRYWSSGPDALPGAVPPAGVVGWPVGGAAEGDDEGDGGSGDGDADCGDADVCGVDDPADVGGELLAAGAAAADGPEW